MSNKEVIDDSAKQDESPLNEFRKRYIYIHDKTLELAVVECPDLVRRITLDETNTYLIRVLALNALLNRPQVMEEIITITKKEYDKFVEDSKWLSYLNAAGVDNWNGYSCAADLMSEDEKEDFIAE